MNKQSILKNKSAKNHAKTTIIIHSRSKRPQQKTINMANFSKNQRHKQNQKPEITA